MAAETFPESYKDERYASIDAATEQKLGIPTGLLSAVRTRGERSNHSQSNDLGTATVYQFIPATKRAILDKYGIDVSLSPQNASEGAGLLLKEGLERNRGDARLAVGEYVGGLDRANWGKTTKAYVQRVTGSQIDAGNAAPDAAQAAPAQGSSFLPPGQSTFDRVSAQMAKPTPDAIANVYAAYQGGQMSPQDSKQFESDVQAGHIMLPRGAALNGGGGQAKAAGGTILPASVVDAYAKGQMSPQDKAQLEADVRDGIVALPPGAQLGNYSAQIPGQAPGVVAPAATAPIEHVGPTSLGDKILGAGEAALAMGTGMVGGPLGHAGGFLGGLAGAIMSGKLGTPEGEKLGEQAVNEGGQSLTYQPRTPSGREQAAAAGGLMQQLVPVMPLTAEMGALGAAAAPARAAAMDTARAGTQAAREAIPAAVKAVRERIPGAAPSTPTPGTLGSVGAAGVDMATQRRAQAADLPVPLDLTKGQAERSFEQQRFEQEAAKNPSVGAPLRERYADQNQQILKNFDAWVDQTGAQAADLRATGVAVDSALVAKAARDKAEIRSAYKSAEKAGELAEPVSTHGVVQLLNESAPAEAVAPVLKAAKAEIVRLGGASMDESGALVPRDMTLGNVELLRRFTNRVAGADPTNIKYAVDLKRAIDASTEGAGGNLYQQARALRSRYASQYENHAVIDKLLNAKRGTSDRAVALEDVWHHSIMKGGLDDVRTVRRVLQTGGEQGKQAWRELQGQTVGWLKSEATKGVGTDIRGNPIVSAAKLNSAIRRLDQDGKLQFIFGRKGAGQLRDINDLAKVVYTSPPGAVNTSNTAGVILGALTEAGVGSFVGLPVPVLSGLNLLSRHMKDRRIQKRVQDALASTKTK